MPDLKTISDSLGILTFLCSVIMAISGAIAIVIGMKKQGQANAEALKDVAGIIKDTVDDVEDLDRRVVIIESQPSCVDLQAECEEGRRLEILEISRQLKEYREQRKTDAVLIANQISSVKQDSDKNFKIIFDEQKKTSVFMARVDEKLKYLDKQNGG